MSEWKVQNELYRVMKQRNRWPILPNCDLITGYEGDLLALTKKRMVYEYEIKCSASDLRADLSKREKWASLDGTCRAIPDPHDVTKKIWILPDEPPDTHGWYTHRCRPDLRPAEFWYVCYGFEPDLDRIPALAGVMIADEREDLLKFRTIHFRELRQAQKLESSPAPQVRVDHAVRNMLYRYWNQRMNLERNT